MTEEALANHPRQKLTFYPDNLAKFQEDSVQRALFSDLQNQRHWQISPPLPFHNDTAKTKAIVGGYLEIYSATDPLSLPESVDRGHFEEVKLLLNRLCEVSKSHGITFELELEDIYVGAIEKGRMNTSLTEGFLSEWESGLKHRDKLFQ